MRDLRAALAPFAEMAAMGHWSGRLQENLLQAAETLAKTEGLVDDA